MHRTFPGPPTPSYQTILRIRSFLPVHLPCAASMRRWCDSRRSWERVNSQNCIYRCASSWRDWLSHGCRFQNLINLTSFFFLLYRFIFCGYNRCLGLIKLSGVSVPWAPLGALHGWPCCVEEQATCTLPRQGGIYWPTAPHSSMRSGALAPPMAMVRAPDSTLRRGSVSLSTPLSMLAEMLSSSTSCGSLTERMKLRCE